MRNRIRSHWPSPAMVVAVIALIAALGGSAVADQAVDAAQRVLKINGKQIKKRTIAGNRLKRNTLTGTQIRESRLGKVPAAARADSATNATNATTAQNAATATNALNLAGAPAGAFQQRIRWALVRADGSGIIAQSGGIEVDGVTGAQYFVDFGVSVAGKGLSVTPSLVTNAFTGTKLAGPCVPGPEGANGGLGCSALGGSPPDVDDGQHVFVVSSNPANTGQAQHAFYITLLP